jgi:hypothetical protein
MGWDEGLEEKARSVLSIYIYNRMKAVESSNVVGQLAMLLLVPSPWFCLSSSSSSSFSGVQYIIIGTKGWHGAVGK